MIPIALGAFRFADIVINPMIAGLAMVLSSLTVVLNALRLKLINFDKKENHKMFSKKFIKEIKVEGMHCKHCAQKVKDALLNIENIKSVKVNVKNGNVKIISKVEINNDIITSTIENLGYKIIK